LTLYEINKTTKSIPHETIVEVFPIEPASLPTLKAYTAEVKGDDTSTVGGKLAYRLRKTLHGHWIWSKGKILTDASPAQPDIDKVVENLWSEQPETFKHLRKISPDSTWKPSAQTYADYVAVGLIGELDQEIRRILDGEVKNLGSVRVERLYESRGWVAGGSPSVSISIFSRLVYNQNLNAYAASLSRPDQLVGLWVSAKASRLKGEIIGVEGRLREHRGRLLALSREPGNIEIIRKAPDDELVVRVESGHNQYEYVLSALRIVVRTADFRKFNVSSSHALRVLRIDPSQRNKLVNNICDMLRARGIIGQSYSSNQDKHLFLSQDDVGFKPSLRFGNDKTLPYEERNLFGALHTLGLYRKSPKFQEGKPIRLGIVNGLADVKAEEYSLALGKELTSLGFRSECVSETTLKEFSRIDMERAIDAIEHAHPDIVVALLPDQLADDEEDDWGLYHEFKSLTVGRGLPSQFVYESTVSKRPAVSNVALGILGKTGNIPFILSQPLSYADMVVGIDIARARKRRLAGSLNATAIARIYFGSGEFLRYVIHDAPLEGESIPDNVLQRLFPVSEFEGKRVVIHRDGYFRGEEKACLQGWAEKIKAEFHLVEIIKTGTPRLCSRQGDQIQQPSKGSAFKLSPTEAFLVSSPPPFPDATAQPLHVKTNFPFTIEQAIHSVLSLTLLHYGSLRAPRLPVTIHYSDKIAYLALRGIKPKALEGNVPFWL
jgi:hypothetical protein